MPLPKNVKIKDRKLPTTPGVYLFKNKKGKVVYVGKATNLKSRVSSYWNGRQMSGGWRTIDEMLHEVARIDYVVTDSVIEALILEANLIRKYMPAYNVKEKDDKSFLYVVVTKEQWPKIMLVRGNELHNPPQPSLTLREGDRSVLPRRVRGSERGLRALKVFGPYTSANSIRAALDIMRKIFPWSTCKPSPQPSPIKGEGVSRNSPPLVGGVRGGGRPRPCFDYHIGRCPGVCIGAVTRTEYMKNIRNLVLFFENKKSRIIKNVEKEMRQAAKEQKFEEAAKLRRKLFALKHIRDIAVITREALHSEEISPARGGQAVMPRGSFEMTHGQRDAMINTLGRIEGYDISNISGVAAVGSLVVFENGEPKKSEYRKFKIKTVVGINDVAMMREVLTRRFAHDGWPMPDLILIDGGWGQVNVAREVVKQYGFHIPIVGIAKGFDRKQDVPIFQRNNSELAQIVKNHKDLLLRVRDEAHRFAITYHRKRMRKRFR